MTSSRTETHGIGQQQLEAQSHPGNRSDAMNEQGLSMSRSEPKKDNHHPPRYLGFLAGVFSGATKLAVGHPFDTVKVRLQTAPAEKFKGPMDCVLQTVRKEGVRGFYKGATPPLVGWMCMDSIMMGSMTNYKRLVKDALYADEEKLPIVWNAVAGMWAGWTVSFVACPIEHVKARLQIQYDAKSKVYSGPIDCAMKLYRQVGFFNGLYRGLFSTMLFRTSFFFFWGSYDVFTHYFKNNTHLSLPVINFLGGGLSATVFWITAYPSDVVKQQIMTDDVKNPRYKTWMEAARGVYTRFGWKGYFRGFVPSMLRSFPTNAAALVTFESIMRLAPS